MPIIVVPSVRVIADRILNIEVIRILCTLADMQMR